MSKRSESIKQLRQMNDEELVEHLRQQRRKLFEIRFQQATGQVENHRLIRDLRREIGRTMTVQIEFARAGAAQQADPTGPAALRPPLTRSGRSSGGAVPSLARHPSDQAEPVAAPKRRRASVKSAAETPARPVADQTDEAKNDE